MSARMFMSTPLSDKCICIGKCLYCNKSYCTDAIKKEDVTKYKNGAMVQEAFPYLSVDDREFIISGVCSKCFNALFDDEEDVIPLDVK
jgi:hypothetical protein